MMSKVSFEFVLMFSAESQQMGLPHHLTSQLHVLKHGVHCVNGNNILPHETKKSIYFQELVELWTYSSVLKTLLVFVNSIQNNNYYINYVYASLVVSFTFL